MAVDPEGFRDAARKFAGGVTVVTVAHMGEVHGMTATSFAAVSLEPPLILVALEETSHTRALVIDAGRFVVNILSEEQVDIAKAFSKAGKKSFEGIPHTSDAAGAPMFDEAIAVLRCATVAVHDGGDHQVFIASVEGTEVKEGRPLVYFDRAYRTVN